MKIGILETGPVAEPLRVRHGDYPAMLRRLLHEADPGLDFRVVRVEAGEEPGAPEAADGWLVTGSRHGVHDPLPWIEPLKGFLRACLDRGVPVVGVCFGHQLLAEALGGRVERAAHGWTLGVQDYRLVDRPGWLLGLDERFALGAIHQDQVVVKPPAARVLALDRRGGIAALAYGPRERPSALSLQPHPEFTPAFLDDLLASLSGTSLPAPAAAAARRSLSRPVEARAWARLLAAHLGRGR